MVLPSAVNISTLLSEISNVGKLFATRFPKITSEEEGAAENTMTEPFESIPYPFAGADANVSELDPVPVTLYALVVESVSYTHLTLPTILLV